MGVGSLVGQGSLPGAAGAAGATGATGPAGPSTGARLARQIFTVGSGTYTPTSGTKRVLLQMVGAGGGSGGCATAGFPIVSGGGGSGTYLQKWIDPGATITGGAYTAGAKGAAGTSGPTAGGDGADSTIVIQGVTYTAKGGKGSGTGGAMGEGAGSKGASSAADVVVHNPGGIGVTVPASSLAQGGPGGGNPLGGGGICPMLTGASSSTGNAPVAGYGGGASGACQDGGGATAGSTGSDGIIIVDEYS